MTFRTKAIIMLCATAALWSTSGYLLIIVDWNPISTTGTRSAIALIPMLIMFGKPQKIKGFVPIMAAVCYAATLFFFVSANRLTTAANVILLQYTAPVYVVLLSAWLLKEKITKQDIVTVILMLAGMMLFFINDINIRGFWGNMLALLSGLTLAIMAVCLRKMKDSIYRGADSIMWGNIICAIIGIPFIAVAGLPRPISWLGLALLGLFQLGLAYCLYVKAVKHVTALELALVPIIEPLLNPILVAIFAFQMPGVHAIIGGIIVVGAVTWNLMYKHRAT
ncbi:MAG: DMT family transporter [Defluviitaleaceae bacterium]|nr:DMT family transporter [Defluviitaleaceae bacterium]